MEDDDVRLNAVLDLINMAACVVTESAGNADSNRPHLSVCMAGTPIIEHIDPTLGDPRVE